MPRVSIYECAGSVVAEEIDLYPEGLFKKERFGCQAIKEYGAG